MFRLLEGDVGAPAKKPRLTKEERLAILRDFAKGLPRSEKLSPAERAKLWRESVRNLPHSEPQSDEAISRESFYEERG